MAQELRQDLKLTQQLVITPQLQLAIKLLQLSRVELLDAIKEEVQVNPLLELDEASVSERSGLEDSSKEPQEGENLSDLYDYLAMDDGRGPSFGTWSDDDDSSPETFLAKRPTLVDHLLWQLKLSRFTPREEEIGTYLIGNIDDDGYLKVELSEVARLFHTSVEEVEDVLKRIQRFDPVGVGARDLKECLLVQLEVLGKDAPLLERIIKEHLEYLERGDHTGLARRLGVSPQEVVEALKVLSLLDPKPGRIYSSDETHYIVPDVYIQKVGNDFVVLLNDDGLPKLRLSPYYREMLKEGDDLSEEAKAYLKERFRSALWFIKSIHQRQRTLYKVASCIAEFQKDFLEKGIDHLKPLILRDVAEAIGVHESTVSRVTTNKYAHTPQGIFELKFFFNKGFHRDGENVAVEAVKEKIRKIIASEDPRRPYADQAIVKILRSQNIDIARRTVAKYRELMGIPPSSKRRRP